MIASSHRLHVATSAIGLMLLVLGCGKGTASETTDRDASIYRTVIVDLADLAGLHGSADEGLPIVFVEAFDPDGIALEVQVAVIAGLLEDYDVRFIDDFEQAVEIDIEQQPVRPESMLVGLGPIAIDKAAGVRAELYEDRENIQAFRYTLGSRGGDQSWSITGEPEPVEPEGFVQPT